MKSVNSMRSAWRMTNRGRLDRLRNEWVREAPNVMRRAWKDLEENWELRICASRLGWSLHRYATRYLRRHA